MSNGVHILFPFTSDCAHLCSFLRTGHTLHNLNKEQLPDKLWIEMKAFSKFEKIIDLLIYWFINNLISVSQFTIVDETCYERYLYGYAF